ncbi:putative spindle pole body protein ppc89 [Elsinoe fawcettii]|nr:putative spindle pole body protein ppc89 [Elsinoe fawcettii]
MAPASQTSGVIAQLTRNQYRAPRIINSSPQLPGQYDGGTSTITSFQPDRESTQHFDTAADEQSWHDNNSVHSASNVSLTSSVPSIEIGRGLKRSTRVPSQRDLDNTDPLLSIPDDSLYALTATPPTKSRKSLDPRKRASLRANPHDPSTKTSDIVPAKTRSTRRTLSDMHARVAAAADSSLVLPSPARAPAQQSRFQRARVTSDIPTRFTSGAGLATGQTPRRSASAAAAEAGNATLASFALPDLPDIVELVSGTRKDGTPVFARTGRGKSRFTSASYQGRGRGEEKGYKVVESVALPEEEKVIFASLQVVKERLAAVEGERDAANRRAEEVESEMDALREQVGMERRLRRYSSNHEKGEERLEQGQWRVQKSELKAEIKSLQQRLERAERRGTTAEIATKRMTQERDSLITQLGVAFYSNEELKEENVQLSAEIETAEDQKAAMQEEIAQLREANRELQAQLAESEKAHDTDLRQWALREAELKGRYKSHSIPHEKRERKEKHAAKEQKSDAKDSQARIMERVEAEVRKARAEAVKRGQMAAREKPTSEEEKSRSRSRAETKRRSIHPTAVDKSPTKTATAMREKWFESLSDETISDTEAAGFARTFSAGQIPATTGAEEDKDVTYLSFLDPSELSALRKKLEAERLAAKGLRATSAPTTEGEKRKSSMRDLTGVVGGEGRNVRVLSPMTADHISYSSPEGNEGDASVVSVGSRRPVRSRSFEEMTSAFILPDITIRDVGGDKGVKHDGKNCTACPANEGKEIRVPKPVPVSEREADVTAVTVRPAEEPKQALARVIKALEDEIVHLKIELGKQQREYARHEPGLGRTKRGEVKGKMDELIKEVERKSEMVYRLYDVLEGQKEKIEETLQSLGVERGSDESVDIVEGSMMGY